MLANCSLENNMTSINSKTMRMYTQDQLFKHTKYNKKTISGKKSNSLNLFSSKSTLAKAHANSQYHFSKSSPSRTNGFRVCRASGRRQTSDVAAAEVPDPAEVEVVPTGKSFNQSAGLSLNSLDFEKIKQDILSGITVSFALIPEATAFALVCGVSPLIALYGAVLMPLITSLVGGRPGMISGAAGATAICLTSLVVQHGVQYFFSAFILAGMLQILAGVTRMGKYIRLVPQPVMLGFVNGLAIVIFMAQFKSFQVPAAVGGGMVWMSPLQLYPMIGLIGVTMFIIQMLPHLTLAVPAPLAAIGVVTGVSKLIHVPIKTVGDIASISGTLPTFAIPAVPLNLHTLEIVFPYAVAVAAVGLTESLLTQQLVDDLTETRSSTHLECLGQGLANMVCGFLGAMGGCAMIGQTMVNMKSGGCGRLSGVATACSVLLFILCGSHIIEAVPIAALVGVMFMVVLSTFAWSSFRMVSRSPQSDFIILVLVTVLTIFTNLAVAVLTGVVASCLAFAWKSAKRVSATRFTQKDGFTGDKSKSKEPRGVYMLSGPLFFGSASRFRELLDPAKEPCDRVILDFLECRVWDTSGIEAIDFLAEKYKAAGKHLSLRHLSEDCRRLLHEAGESVEVNISEDPWYGVATDYDSALGQSPFSKWSPPHGEHFPIESSK